MNKEFIPYEEAKALKELGFDEPCSSFYKRHDSELYYDSILQSKKVEFRNNTQLNIFGDLREKISAPLYQQAFRWFREEYGYQHEISKPLSWLLSIKSSTKRICLEDYMDYKEPTSYEEAELACLKKLIEIVNQNKDE